MNKGRFFYFRMAATNMLLNAKLYTPYLVTCIVTVAMSFIISSMALTELPGGSSMLLIMRMGQVLMALFSGVFLFYTNSFLMRRRRRELALYNILGLEKRHIARVLLEETLLTGIICLALGLLLGAVLDKLMYLVLLNLMRYDVTEQFSLYPSAFLVTLGVFVVIFLLILGANLLRIRKINPIELLHSESMGEKEPRTKWPLVLIGVLSLGTGYAIAVTVKDVFSALMLFFVAVVLVIIGTYCLFTAGTIAVLKAMKANQKFYYRPQHFVSVSGLLFRMKQNAAGLANICILSTMVLVTVSVTVSTYFGSEEIMRNRYPKDISITLSDASQEEKTQMFSQVQQLSVELGLPMEHLARFDVLEVAMGQKGDAFSPDPGYVDGWDITYFGLITADSYRELTGEEVVLERGQVLAYVQEGHLPEQFDLLGETYTVSRFLDENPMAGRLTAYTAVNVYYLILPDEAELNRVFLAQKEAYGEAASPLKHMIQFDVDGRAEEILEFSGQLPHQQKGVLVECREENVQESYSLYGSFLFLGVFMGSLFLMVTVLIMYYKQLVEGYDDRAKFEIMQKVGMDERQIRGSIRSQVLTMFLLPLVTAGIHLTFAFPLLSRLLRALHLTQVHLFMLCTVGTLLVFAVIYVLMYLVTARTYYRIVSGGKER